MDKKYDVARPANIFSSYGSGIISSKTLSTIILSNQTRHTLVFGSCAQENLLSSMTRDRLWDYKSGNYRNHWFLRVNGAYKIVSRLWLPLFSNYLNPAPLEF